MCGQFIRHVNVCVISGVSCHGASIDPYLSQQDMQQSIRWPEARLFQLKGREHWFQATTWEDLCRAKQGEARNCRLGLNICSISPLVCIYWKWSLLLMADGWDLERIMFYSLNCCQRRWPKLNEWSVVLFHSTIKVQKETHFYSSF